MLDAILAMYGQEFAGLDWRPAGGGFSGAAVFAGSEPGEPEPRFALKRWPRGKTLFLIEQSHGAQCLFRKQLDCVPAVIENRWFRSVSTVEGFSWDLCEWRPGAPSSVPTPRQIAAAAEVMAVLHRDGPAIREPLWNPVAIRTQHVNESLAACSNLTFDSLPLPLRTLCVELCGLLQSVSNPGPIPDVSRHSTLIHGDLHAGHILFTSDAVTGIIDFASTKIDHPAVDVARYFGETAQDEQTLADAVSVYRTAGGDPGVTLELVQFLIKVIRRGAAAYWLRRFSGNDIPADLMAAASGRLTAVLQRLRAEH